MRVSFNRNACLAFDVDLALLLDAELIGFSGSHLSWNAELTFSLLMQRHRAFQARIWWAAWVSCLVFERDHRVSFMVKSAFGLTSHFRLWLETRVWVGSDLRVWWCLWPRLCPQWYLDSLQRYTTITYEKVRLENPFFWIKRDDWKEECLKLLPKHAHFKI